MKKYFVFLFFLLGCASTPEPSPPSVLVSIPPYAYLVQRMVGDRVKVEVLVPPDANPHLYEPSPKQVQSILRTQAWFRLGEPMEEKILTVFKEKKSPSLVLDLSEGMPLLDAEPHLCRHGGHTHSHESQDKHLWMSPKLVKIQAEKIFQALSQVYPELKTHLKEGFTQLTHDLEKLDQDLTEQLKPYAGDSILVSHPAFGYYCNAYHLKQLSVECEGKDPRPKDIEKTVKEAALVHIQSIFTQPQYNNKAAMLIGNKLHIPVYEVDPYAYNYLENMRHITDLLTTPHTHD